VFSESGHQAATRRQPGGRRRPPDDVDAAFAAARTSEILNQQVDTGRLARLIDLVRRTSGDDRTKVRDPGWSSCSTCSTRPILRWSPAGENLSNAPLLVGLFRRRER